MCLWPGGGAFYIEPPSAVPLNNELAAVRGEAAAAEDNVLWQLTGQIIDNVEDMQRALDNVSMAGLFAAVVDLLLDAQYHIGSMCWSWLYRTLPPVS